MRFFLASIMLDFIGTLSWVNFFCRRQTVTRCAMVNCMMSQKEPKLALLSWSSVNVFSLKLLQRPIIAVTTAKAKKTWRKNVWKAVANLWCVWIRVLWIERNCSTSTVLKSREVLWNVFFRHRSDIAVILKHKRNEATIQIKIWWRVTNGRASIGSVFWNPSCFAYIVLLITIYPMKKNMYSNFFGFYMSYCQSQHIPSTLAHTWDWYIYLQKNHKNQPNVPSQSFTWNLKMMVSKRNPLFQRAIFRFHVHFLGCR